MNFYEAVSYHIMNDETLLSDLSKILMQESVQLKEGKMKEAMSSFPEVF